MSRLAKKEKRLHPRVNLCLPMKVAVNGYDFGTTTQNISCLGAYCTIDKYVPPFTRVMIKMDIPQEQGRAGSAYDVKCKGVVVRTQDRPEGGFDIAVFFNAIAEEERKKISQYIGRFLPEDSAKSSPCASNP